MEYTAPELLNQSKSTKKIDIWALGIMLYQMVNDLQHPFESCDKFEMLDQIFNKGPSPLPESLSPFIK
jgi:serine/threonine protein kinase